MHDPTDIRAQVQDFLVTRRNRLTPESTGLPVYGGNRRVPGLRREEVALLAGLSVDHYVRLERGNLGGASDAVLEALAAALQLNVYTPEPDSPEQQALSLLGSWAETADVAR